MWNEAISEDDYHAHPALGSGTIRRLQKGSAHHFLRKQWECVFGADFDTKALWFGRNFHAAVLTPELFWPKVVVIKRFETYVCKEARDHVKQLKKDNPPDSIFLRFEEEYLLLKMRQAILDHEIISEILNQPGRCEVAGFFKDQETGVECKIKPDKISPSRKWIIDLKTMREINGRAVLSTAIESGWHVQAAHYLEGANAIDGADSYTKFMFLCVQKSPPFTVACYVCSDELIEAGKNLRKKALLNFKNSFECGRYSDENSGVFNLEKPLWLKDNMND